MKGSKEQLKAWIEEIEDDIAQEEREEISSLTSFPAINFSEILGKGFKSPLKDISTAIYSPYMPLYVTPLTTDEFQEVDGPPGITYFKDIKPMNEDKDISNALTQKQSYNSPRPCSASDIGGHVGGEAIQYSSTLKIRIEPKGTGIEYQVLEKFIEDLFKKGGAKAVAAVTPQMKKDLLLHIKKTLLTQEAPSRREGHLMQGNRSSRRRVSMTQLKKSFEPGVVDTKVTMSRRDKQYFKEVYLSSYLLATKKPKGKTVATARRYRPDELRQVRILAHNRNDIKRHNELREQVNKFQEKLFERESKKRGLHLVTSSTKLLTSVDQVRNFGKELESINDCED